MVRVATSGTQHEMQEDTHVSVRARVCGAALHSCACQQQPAFLQLACRYDASAAISRHVGGSGGGGGVGVNDARRRRQACARKEGRKGM